MPHREQWICVIAATKRMVTTVMIYDCNKQAPGDYGKKIHGFGQGLGSLERLYSQPPGHIRHSPTECVHTHTHETHFSQPETQRQLYAL